MIEVSNLDYFYFLKILFKNHIANYNNSKYNKLYWIDLNLAKLKLLKELRY